MTFVLMLLLGGGVLLIVSAIECTSIVQTFSDVLDGTIVGYTWRCGGGKPGTASGGNPITGGILGVGGTLAGPASSTPPQVARLVPWVRNGWSG